MGCVRVHHSLSISYDVSYCSGLFIISRAIQFHVLFLYTCRKIGSATFLSKFLRYSILSLSLSLSIYIYMIRDVANFKGNKFITNVLISLRINFFWETEKRFFEISFKMDIPKGMIDESISKWNKNFGNVSGSVSGN